MPCRCLLVDVGEVRSESTEIGSTPLLARRLVSSMDGGSAPVFVRRVCCSMTCGSAPLLSSPTYLARWFVGRRRVSMVNLTFVDTCTARAHDVSSALSYGTLSCTDAHGTT
ncbi:unnamed protein product, partial [Trichogramma brassicae]